MKPVWNVNGDAVRSERAHIRSECLQSVSVWACVCVYVCVCVCGLVWCQRGRQEVISIYIQFTFTFLFGNKIVEKKRRKTTYHEVAFRVSECGRGQESKSGREINSKVMVDCVWFKRGTATPWSRRQSHFTILFFFLLVCPFRMCSFFVVFHIGWCGGRLLLLLLLSPLSLVWYEFDLWCTKPSSIRNSFVFFFSFVLSTKFFFSSCRLIPDQQQQHQHTFTQFTQNHI